MSDTIKTAGAQGADQTPAFDWRKYLKVHPAAELYPRPSPTELQALADDIKVNGLAAEIVMWHSPASPGVLPEGPAVLNGITRLDALALLGLLYETPDHHVGLRRFNNGHWNEKKGERIDFKYISGGNPYALALALNAEWRTLNFEQKRELIAKVLKATPATSNNSLGKLLKVDDKTIASVRQELEANSEIPNKTDRVEASGRKARGRKPGAKKTVQPARKPGDGSPGFGVAWRTANRLGRDINVCGDRYQLTDPNFPESAYFSSLKSLRESLKQIAAEQAASGAPKTTVTTTPEPVPAEITTTEPPEATPARVNARDTALEEFDGHILRLLQQTKKQKPERFAKTAVPFVEILELANFLIRVVPKAGDAQQRGNGVDPEKSADAAKAAHAAAEPPASEATR